MSIGDYIGAGICILAILSVIVGCIVGIRDEEDFDRYADEQDGEGGDD